MHQLIQTHALCNCRWHAIAKRLNGCCLYSVVGSCNLILDFGCVNGQGEDVTHTQPWRCVRLQVHQGGLYGGGFDTLVHVIPPAGKTWSTAGHEYLIDPELFLYDRLSIAGTVSGQQATLVITCRAGCCLKKPADATTMYIGRFSCGIQFYSPTHASHVVIDANWHNNNKFSGAPGCAFFPTSKTVLHGLLSHTLMQPKLKPSSLPTLQLAVRCAMMYCFCLPSFGLRLRCSAAVRCYIAICQYPTNTHL